MPTTATRSPAGQRLSPQQQRDVEQFAQGVDAHDAGRLEQRLHADVRDLDRGLPQPLREAPDLVETPPTLHGDDGFVPGQPAGQARELARIAEALQVEQRDVGRVVGFPVLQQVIARDVRAVSGRDERRHAEPTPSRLAEHRHAQRTGLAEEAGPTGERRQRRERRVEPHRPVGVDHAQAVRPDDAHAVLAGGDDQRPLRVEPGIVAALAESSGDHDQPVHAFRRALLDDRRYRVGRNADDGEVDRVGHIGDRGVGAHARDVPGLLVDREQLAVEAHSQQVAKHQVADLGLVVARADDSDRRREEQPPDRPGLGVLLALVHHLLGHRGLVDVELEVDLAVIEMPDRLVAGIAEDPQHRAVLGEHHGGEPRDTDFARRGGQMFEQRRPDPPSLMGVGDDESDLGLVRPRLTVVAPDRDDLVAQQGNQGDTVVVIDVGETVQVTLRDARIRREEAQVTGARRQRHVERDERVGIGRLDRAQVHDAAVGDHHVGLPVRGKRPRTVRLAHVSPGDHAGRARAAGTPPGA